MVAAAGNPDHVRYCEALSAADEAHRRRKIDAEKQYAIDVKGAEAHRLAALEALPKRWGQDGQGRQFAVGGQDDGTIAKAHLKAVEAAESKRAKAIEKSTVKHTSAVAAARAAWRKSAGFAGYY